MVDTVHGGCVHCLHSDLVVQSTIGNFQRRSTSSTKGCQECSTNQIKSKSRTCPLKNFSTFVFIIVLASRHHKTSSTSARGDSLQFQRDHCRGSRISGQIRSRSNIPHMHQRTGCERESWRIRFVQKLFPRPGHWVPQSAHSGACRQSLVHERGTCRLFVHDHHHDVQATRALDFGGRSGLPMSWIPRFDKFNWRRAVMRIKLNTFVYNLIQTKWYWQIQKK